jgi:hypothetical protein
MARSLRDRAIQLRSPVADAVDLVAARHDHLPAVQTLLEIEIARPDDPVLEDASLALTLGEKPG